MENDTELIKHLYEDFNARKVDSILAKLTEDVMWANGMDGGYVHGHKGLRDYWERQWSSLNPQIKPVSFRKTEEGSIFVDALFTGQPMEGQTQDFKDMPVGHVFHLKDGLVSRFDIQGRS
jgi:ketosteroid isomerase-like protein